ncbi:YihY/virulence factor BrkB family protein [Thalassococcus sp. CAU 1522]|uniref:YihY/virulence factor BrkB family protein n=1 Tax=Thalassococcus arenae TaxID=2851652 RepID=A0ABS6N3P9_9RHOB|nr:YihY/virulence factor BrkB family protein [Thalassococcus arenae]MBV2358408.1 YihY/virulence factor BrkB family protein [Thalassococcus arenae]
MTHGRNATHPQEIPARGWLDVARRVWARQSKVNLGLLAAGIAFYGLLSLFPGLTALVAITGLVFDSSLLIDHSQTIAAVLPESARELVLGQLREVLGGDAASLTLAALFTLAVSLFSASRAVGNLIAGLNVVYEENETRGIIALTGLNIVLTVSLVLAFLVSLLAIAALPVLAGWLGALVPGDLILMVRWPILLAIAATGIAVLYRFGPDRRAAKWRWLSPGATLACLLWVAGSLGFNVYVQTFGSYNETFGALGGVIVLLTWLWLSAFILLLGALVDAELEAQTARDSTIGPDRPMGQRGAVKADTVAHGPSRDRIGPPSEVRGHGS